MSASRDGDGTANHGNSQNNKHTTQRFTINYKMEKKGNKSSLRYKQQVSQSRHLSAGSFIFPG